MYLENCDMFYLIWLLGDNVLSCSTKQKYEVLDVGILHPNEVSTGVLYVY